MISEMLNALIKERGLSVYRLSKEIGINQGTMDRYAKGENTPEGKNLVKIADYFNISTDTLLGREKPPLEKVAKGTMNNPKIFGGNIVLYNESGDINEGGIENEEKKSERNMSIEEMELIRIFNALGFDDRLDMLNYSVGLYRKSASIAK